ncbi:MAG TPA: M13 family metallopeptidase [Woeseiaceae bacterium]|nr:M13 family metallopeptidase [Woeseiaceae bacterium]
MKFFNACLLTIAVSALVACSGSDEPELVSGVHLDALDTSTRPQDDFYQFANGGWLDGTEIPEIYSGYTVYHEVSERVEDALRTIVENAANGSNEPGSEAQKVGDLYSSFMDIETINTQGIEPLQPRLKAIEDIDSIESLTTTMASLLRSGVAVPYRIQIYPALEDSSRYTVYINQSGITMPNRDYYLQVDNENFAEAREGLRPYIASMLARSGMDAEEAATAAENVYALETAIATVQWDSVRNRDPQQINNPYSVEELPELGSNMHWGESFAALGIDGEEQVIIEQPSYFEALDGLLTDISLNTWRQYLTFRLLDGSGLYLDETTATIRFDYRNRILYGQKEPEPRWKQGVALVDGLIGEAVGKLYVAEYFPPEAKAKMQELVDNVIATFDESLDDLEWMSPATRIKSKEKLAKFIPKIGYPDEWRDYSTLKIVAGDNFGNISRAIAWDYERDLAKLGTPVDNKEWGMTPQTVNAYYDPSKNEIVFPAARLQPPFFQLNADDAINYGAVGGVIGHEISHGFDDSGSQFDGDGNLANWWTDRDREAFEEKTRVLVSQYEKFSPVEGMHVNGELTLGENIGDLSGIAMAYRAYIRSLNGQEAPVIDGFTGPQRFFIGYAMSRKGKYRDAAIINRLASDTHSPLEFRVNGPYPNIDAFHEAFGTMEGDGMWLAPDVRVRIW